MKVKNKMQRTSSISSKLSQLLYIWLINTLLYKIVLKEQQMTQMGKKYSIWCIALFYIH